MFKDLKNNQDLVTSMMRLKGCLSEVDEAMMTLFTNNLNGKEHSQEDIDLLSWMLKQMNEATNV